MPHQFSLVIDRFPAHQQAIAEHQHIDPSFRELCKDYDEVVTTLLRIERTPNGKADKHYNNFVRLCGDLEAEIIKRLGLG